MKKTGVCPKCSSTDIRVLKRRIWGTIIPVSSTIFGAAYSRWFICASCGFNETWVEDEKSLEKIRKKLDRR